MLLQAQENTEQPQGQSRFVSDDLFIYMHAGPSTDYRILGSVNAGDEVRTLESQQGYSKIIDAKGREAWIDEKYLVDTPGVRVQLRETEQELKNLQQSQSDSNAETLALRQQVSQLQTKNKDLTTTLAALEKEQQQLKTSLEENSRQQQMDWFMKGAGVLFGGLLLGLILPRLMPQKRRRDAW